jgi:hypothetical protein
VVIRFASFIVTTLHFFNVTTLLKTYVVLCLRLAGVRKDGFALKKDYARMVFFITFPSVA